MSKTNATMKNDRKNASDAANFDMSYCVPARDYQTLQDAAYQDFSQNGSEGKTHRIYLDVYGNPTVGVGHLIMPKKGLGNKTTEEAYRQKYLALDLRDANGHQLSNAEKSSQFSSILQAMKEKSFKTTGGCPNYVNYPAVGILSEAGVKEAFKGDYDYVYNRVKKKFPDVDKYPLSLQLSLTHCCYAGALGKVKNTGNFADIAQQVAKARSGKACSFKEKEMAQQAVRECSYLVNQGLNPLGSSRENMMSALNVNEPSFTPNYDEMFKDVPPEQKQQKITEYENRDNVMQGSMLMGLFAGDDNEADILSAMLMQALLHALGAVKPEQTVAQSGNDNEQSGVQYVVDKSEKYQFAVGEFDVKSENFARDFARQLTYNINNGYRGFCSAGQQYCAGAGTGTLNQVGEKYDIFDIGVKGVGCKEVRDKFAKVYGSSGYTPNCYETLKQKMAQNPTLPQVFTLTVGSKYSNSGLHYLTVAPTIDKNGEIVRDENGAVKYSVYGFNRNVIKDFDKYNLKKEGNVFPITEMAYNRMKEKENNMAMAAMAARGAQRS